MKAKNLFSVLALSAGAAVLAGQANAANIDVTSDITVSETWTNDNVYNLTTQIYVLPGASLTIEPGTVIASSPTMTGAGALAVTRGAQIFVNGTVTDPVIFTTTNDVATWDVDGSHPTGRNPKTGTWREAANEWGALAIMGNALISDSLDPDNDALPNGTNETNLEGLVASGPSDTRVLYGGNDDDDDSGSVTYVSLRYGGRVIGLGDELNALSLAGVGRETEISYVDIMNNVDDGIEIFGGTVNISHFNIWNVGDDSLDIDQGYRGKIQFGLIVQGYSVDASQGSGVGDNAIEIDGAEDSDAQPVTTTSIYNLTVIGQPIDGDGLTAWRDNARVQYRNCIFMDGGEALIRADNVDGDGSQGYGFNGTHSFADVFTTSFDTYPSVNQGDVDTLAEKQALYPVQVDGNLAEISDSVFARMNTAGSAFTNSDARGVTANNGVGVQPNDNVYAGDTTLPITTLTRESVVSKGGLQMLRVSFIDPTPVGDAATSVGSAPNDEFFVAANYRGAFAPASKGLTPARVWIRGWTAIDAYDGVVAGPATAVDAWQVFE
ncbi:MAG: hypothetical protein RLY93_07005 [Sumerlaeia bacterium]